MKRSLHVRQAQRLEGANALGLNAMLAQWLELLHGFGIDGAVPFRSLEAVAQEIAATGSGWTATVGKNAEDVIETRFTRSTTEWFSIRSSVLYSSTIVVEAPRKCSDQMQAFMKSLVPDLRQ